MLSGEIDMAATVELFACLQSAERQTPGRVAIDLSGVTFLDSAGIGVLARLVAAGVVLELSNATGIAERALKIAGLLP
jgi:anti-anti-sigma factor